ncbi:cystatin-9-like isoform X1 [Nycticebus coucang]|uniref:cystatin-9-like isoform X1 n=1 Tax=Nycticebus coucang TaxID=9470 RepID=UPI00234D6B26|nr:cystatin-9-like isoform X1 [Nycticebus coucang]
MSCLPWTRALPWALLLLVSGFQLLLTQPWCSEEEKNTDNHKLRDPEFSATVKFVLHTFNQQSKDDYAYRLERVLSSWQEHSRNKQQENPRMVFSMKLQLRRTWCGRFEDDIDDCPFQERPELNNTVSCFFTISTIPRIKWFKLLKKTCSVGFP